ncbi:MAG: DUF1292 domain-containing protein [Thermoflavifilum sp.]|nr:DUF1292 domain-containing protein [Thermoflavifilum sp.]MCL6513233.1 DUF1292 domain-containing protein [Alicyclobacillus sp.]
MADEHVHDHDHDEFDDEIIVLEDEEGNEHNFVLGEVLSVDGKDYAILLPIDEDVEEGVIFRIEGEEGDEMILADIEDDAEWQRVVEAYNAEYAEDEDDEG